MTAPEIIEEVTSAGGIVTLAQDGEHIRAFLPEHAASLAKQLQANQPAILQFLRERTFASPYTLAVKQAEQCEPPEPGALMDAGIRLLDWQPKRPPVAITDLRIVNNVGDFIREMLTQLESAVAAKNDLDARRATELLAQVGVSVRVEM